VGASCRSDDRKATRRPSLSIFWYRNAAMKELAPRRRGRLKGSGAGPEATVFKKGPPLRRCKKERKAA